MDKIKDVLFAGLKQAMEGDEHRLYRAGKLPGLFPARTGVCAEAAAEALRDGLLELLRTDAKGKTVTEWVRLTPKGTDFVVNAESPIRALDELRDVLRVTEEGLPRWVAQIQNQIQQLSQRVTDEVQQISNRLDTLSSRVQQAIKRAEASNPKMTDEELRSIIWAEDALGYLERRRGGKLAMPCPLPELFAVIRGEVPDLSIRDFHTGLRRLCDRAVLRLFPFAGGGQMLEPEYALLEDSTLFYYVDRR